MACAVPAWGQQLEESRKAFESLYGDRIKAVRATPDRADDLELAKSLLDSAGTTEDAPGLVLAMCNAVYDLTSNHPAGFPLAAQSMRLLIDQVPQFALDAPERLVDVLRKQFARTPVSERAAVGDELINAFMISARIRDQGGDYTEAAKLIRQALSMAETIKSPRVAGLKHRFDVVQSRAQVQTLARRAETKLRTTPDDAAAHAELTRYYLLELHDPAKAATHAKASSDEALKAIASIVEQPFEDLSDKECLTMADWYRAASNNATPYGKLLSLEIASRSYQRYLAITRETGLTPSRAKLALDEVDKAFQALTPPAGSDAEVEKPTASVKGKSKVMETLASIKPEDGWVDVMKVIDPERAHRGVWKMEKGKLTRYFSNNQDGGAFLPLPFSAKNVSYEIELVFERPTEGVQGTGSFWIHAGSACAWFEVGTDDKGDLSGIGLIDGKSHWENITTNKRINFPAKKPHVVIISIKSASDKIHIKSLANGQNFIEFQGTSANLTMRDYDWLAVGGFGTTTYHRIRLRAVDGEIVAKPYSRR